MCKLEVNKGFLEVKVIVIGICELFGCWSLKFIFCEWVVRIFSGWVILLVFDRVIVNDYKVFCFVNILCLI